MEKLETKQILFISSTKSWQIFTCWKCVKMLQLRVERAHDGRTFKIVDTVQYLRTMQPHFTSFEKYWFLSRQDLINKLFRLHHCDHAHCTVHVTRAMMKTMSKHQVFIQDTIYFEEASAVTLSHGMHSCCLSGHFCRCLWPVCAVHRSLARFIVQNFLDQLLVSKLKRVMD